MINRIFLLAQISDPVGSIKPPVGNYDNAQTGIMAFASNIVKMLIIGGGLFTFFNILMAGITFMSAGGDPKKVEQAWSKIWQSLIGLVIMIGSFVIIAIVGYFVCGNPLCFLEPEIYGPGSSQ